MIGQMQDCMMCEPNSSHTVRSQVLTFTSKKKQARALLKVIKYGPVLSNCPEHRDRKRK